VTFAEYLALDAVNWSSLKHMRVSPLAYKHALTAPRKDSPAMAMGRAVHVAVLEPDEFPRRYVLGEKFDRRTKEGKEAHARQVEAAGEREILSPEDYTRALSIRDAVRGHSEAASVLAGAETESTLVWTCPYTGIKCKGRLDALQHGGVRDLKTCADLSRFRSQAWSLGWFHQLEWYRWGLAVDTIGRGADRDWRSSMPPLFVAVESNAPHDVAVFEPDDDTVAMCRHEIADLMRTLAECRESNVWPGKYPHRTTIAAPRWANASDEDEFQVNVSEET